MFSTTLTSVNNVFSLTCFWSIIHKQYPEGSLWSFKFIVSCFPLSIFLDICALCSEPAWDSSTSSSLLTVLSLLYLSVCKMQVHTQSHSSEFLLSFKSQMFPAWILPLPYACVILSISLTVFVTICLLSSYQCTFLLHTAHTSEPLEADWWFAWLILYTSVFSFSPIFILPLFLANF